MVLEPLFLLSVASVVFYTAMTLFPYAQAGDPVPFAMGLTFPAEASLTVGAVWMFGVALSKYLSDGKD